MTDLVAFSEIAGALAIVLSLMFLAWELHQTRKQSELSNWRDVLQGLVELKRTATDAEFASLLVRGRRDYGTLSEEDKLRYGMYLEQAVHIYGNFLKHNDSLPRRLEGLESAIGHSLREELSTPGGAAWWQEAHRRKRFMPNTYVTVNALVARYRPDPDDGTPQ